MRLLHFIQGERPDVPTLAAVYALTVAGSIWCLDLTLPIGLVFLQAMLCLDLIGGVFFNLTHSTKSFWQTRARAFRLIFLVGHLAQPLLMWSFFSLNSALALALYGYMLTTGIILEFARGQWNRIGSVAFCLLGIFVFQQLRFPVEYGWFLFAYLTKLLISFSMKTA